MQDMSIIANEQASSAHHVTRQEVRAHLMKGGNYSEDGRHDARVVIE
jgi:hypothetical protein